MNGYFFSAIAAVAAAAAIIAIAYFVYLGSVAHMQIEQSAAEHGMQCIWFSQGFSCTPTGR